MPPDVSHLVPKGRLAATNELWLAIGLPMRDRGGLEGFVADISNPQSPNFRHFLTREQVAGRFGPTEQDYEAVKSFATTNGLAIKATQANRLVLDVAGPVAAVERAFHIKLQTYSHPTEARDFYAPDSEPSVDAKLPVMDVEGLTDYWLPHSRLREHSREADATSKNGSGPVGYLFGNDFRNAYVPGTTLTGAGQSVGLVEFSGTTFYTNDIFNYANLAGGGRTNILVTSVNLDGFGGKTSGSATELELDIEMAMAMAPGLSNIVCFITPGNGSPNDILNSMLSHSNILNLSCSWGWSGPSNTTDAIFLSMDAVGQTFFNASGDNGAFTAGSNSVNGVDNPAALNTPSSNPYITQVGGTTLKMNGAGASWASEVVWNWGTDSRGNYSGTGSGASSGGISSYYAIPAWQTNISDMTGRGGSTQFRNIPDVAACADLVYVIYDNGKSGTNSYIGGTSCAAPLWAGFMALVNQQSAASGGPAAGFINPALYALADGPNYLSDFHDITSGSNIWKSSPNLFYATNGYDLVTGLGSMNGTSMINALSVPPPAPVFLNPASDAGKITLNWTSLAGQLYQLQYSTNLAAANWINLGSPISATGSVTTTNDSLTDGRRFYRVVLLQPL